jgi:hypothetical protein
LNGRGGPSVDALCAAVAIEAKLPAGTALVS